MSDNSFSKIRHVRAFDQAVKQMRFAILDGDYLNGQKLPTEQELCELMNVSRSTIREALRVLEAEGLIEVRKGSGAYVLDEIGSIATRGEVLKWLAQREESVLEILHVREVIEGLTAKLAAIHASEEEIQELEMIIDAQVKETKTKDKDKKAKKLAQLDVLFHTSISLMSQNNLAHEIVSKIVPAFSEANRAILWVGDGITNSLKEHKHVLEAIKNGNPDSAEKIIRSHIQGVQERICEYLNEIDCSENE